MKAAPKAIPPKIYKTAAASAPVAKTKAKQMTSPLVNPQSISVCKMKAPPRSPPSKSNPAWKASAVSTFSSDLLRLLDKTPSSVIYCSVKALAENLCDDQDAGGIRNYGWWNDKLTINNRGIHFVEAWIREHLMNDDLGIHRRD